MVQESQFPEEDNEHPMASEPGAPLPPQRAPAENPTPPTVSAEAEPNKDKPNKAGIDAHPYATQHMTGNPEWSSAKSGVARALLCREPAALPGA